MDTNNHQMTTRSKSNGNDTSSLSEKNGIFSDDSSVDENGNLKEFIDYDCDDDFDHEEFDKQLNRLKKTKPQKRKKKLNMKKNKNDKKLNDVFMNYLIMKATEKANLELSKRKKQKRKNKVKVEVSDEENSNTENETLETINLDSNKTSKLDTILTLDFSSDSSDTSFEGDEINSFEEDEINSFEGDEINSFEEDEINSESEISIDTNNTIFEEEVSTPKLNITPKIQEDKSTTTSSDDEEYSFEYDDHDEKYEELIDKQMLKNSEEANMEYYH